MAFQSIRLVDENKLNEALGGIQAIPSGGTSGQVLKKKSNTDFDVEWGEGGSTDDMLKSVYDTNDNGKVDNAEAVEGHTVASSGDAGVSDLVLGNDSRLSDTRTPKAHTHTLSDITDAGTAASRNATNSIISGSTDVAEAGAVKNAIDAAIVSAYKAGGTKACANLTSALLVAANEGKVYNITDTGTTTADFIEGAGKPIGVGADVAVIKVSNSYKFNLLPGIIDTSTLQPKALTTSVESQSTVEGALSALSTNKTSKVSGATNGNFAALDANGNLKDSGHKHSDYLTSHQDISSKADKVSGATNNHLASLDANGNLKDSGKSASSLVPTGGTTGQVLKKKSNTNYDVEWQNESGGGSGSTYYGTSNTASATTEKAVTISGTFAYTKGQVISVLFTTANSANAPTLNVNGLGAKSIYNNNAVLSSTNALKWSANKLITFVYDGTYFRVVSVEPSLDGGSWWGTSSTSATTAAKTVTCANFRLIQGAEISVKFSTANTKTNAALTLNVNSTGAKTIYANGAATSSTNQLTWEANEILTFVYDGSYWVCLTETMGVSALGLSVIDGKIAQTITTL